jgi:hypothetical protein
LILPSAAGISKPKPPSWVIWYTENGAVAAFRARMSISSSTGQTSPVVFAGTHEEFAPHTGAGDGPCRNSAISRKISSNSTLGITTLRSWKIT